MSLHVFMVGTSDWAPLADIVLPTWTEYCREYGYKFHVEWGRKPEYDGFHISFSKIAQVLEYFKREMPQALWCVDMDMMITNHRIAAQNFPSAKHAITITKDINGLNSGSFFLNGFWTLKCELWLRSILSLRHHTTSEQHAMNWLEEAYKEDTFYYPQPSFNSIDYRAYPAFNDKNYTEKDGQWEGGHLLVHLPGQSLQERLARFPQYIPQIIK